MNNQNASQQRTREFNAENWTGETLTVDFDELGNFELGGDKFNIGPLCTVDYMDNVAGNGWRVLNGDAWNDSLTTLYFMDGEGNDLEAAVIAAARYVLNCV